jgi:hypothetical protein
LAKEEAIQQEFTWIATPGFAQLAMTNQKFIAD